MGDVCGTLTAGGAEALAVTVDGESRHSSEEMKADCFRHFVTHEALDLLRAETSHAVNQLRDEFCKASESQKKALDELQANAAKTEQVHNEAMEGLSVKIGHALDWHEEAVDSLRTEANVTVQTFKAEVEALADSRVKALAESTTANSDVWRGDAVQKMVIDMFKAESAKVDESIAQAIKEVTADTAKAMDLYKLEAKMISDLLQAEELHKKALDAHVADAAKIASSLKGSLEDLRAELAFVGKSCKADFEARNADTVMMLRGEVAEVCESNMRALLTLKIDAAQTLEAHRQALEAQSVQLVSASVSHNQALQEVRNESSLYYDELKAHRAETNTAIIALRAEMIGAHESHGAALDAKLAGTASTLERLKSDTASFDVEAAKDPARSNRHSLFIHAG